MKKILNKLTSLFDHLFDFFITPVLYRLWMFFHDAPFDKVGDAYMNGQRHYREFLCGCYNDGILPDFLDLQRNGSYEAIGFELGTIKDGFYAFDTLKDAELWSANGDFPNSRAIIPFYGVVANNFIELFSDDTYYGQIPN